MKANLILTAASHAAGAGGLTRRPNPEGHTVILRALALSFFAIFIAGCCTTSQAHAVHMHGEGLEPTREYDK